MNKDQLLSKCNAIKDKQERILKESEELETALLQYRIESVERVLNFINDGCWNGYNFDNKELQTLITYCLNKLNGNIDGVELSLEE